MKNKSWRKEVSPEIKEFLESLVENVHKHKPAYVKSKNPSSAQLWCALAHLSKQVFDLNIKIKILEKVLKDNLQKPSHIKEIPSKEERNNFMSIAGLKKKNL